MAARDTGAGGDCGIQLPTASSVSGWPTKEEWGHGGWSGRFSGARPGSGVSFLPTVCCPEFTRELP